MLALRAVVRAAVPITKRATPFAVIVGAASVYSLKLRIVRCEVEALHDPWLLRDIAKQSGFAVVTASPASFVIYVWRTCRKLIRCISLFVRFFPLLITYPLAFRGSSLESFWWKWLLFTVRSSGPTFLKLGQWASTRRDVFSKEFCDKLSILHTKTKKQRLFREKEAVFDELFGKGFFKKHGEKVFTQIEPFSIGSGCIAQVYKATVDVQELEEATGMKYPLLSSKKTADVAIKVADNSVDSQIELDLSIIRSAAYTITTLMPSLCYVDPMGAIEQFEMVLRRQVDLGNEGRALIKFAENFDPAKSGIRFPIVIRYTKNILMETFEEGIYINRLVAEVDNPELKNRQSSAVRRRIALLGARALLKMIFVDNFVHGDLHPGNILIRFNDDVGTLPGVHIAPPPEGLLQQAIDWVQSFIGWRTVPKIRFTDSPFMQDEPTLVLLDTGIAVSETPEKLTNLKTLFRCIVERKGYEAGRMLLTHSPKQNCRDPDRFCRQVETLVDKALSEKSLRKLNISGLLSEMFSIVAEHQVSLDSSFTTVILSVMVLEGFGRSLDPDLDLFQCARPYLLNVFL